MEKCRLCLGDKKNVRNIFDRENENSFADMITSLSTVKLNKGDGITENICLGCRKKLKEAFDFKLMIERSDAVLQSFSKNKKIYFDNLKDINIKIEITDEYIPKCKTNLDGYLKNSEDFLFYNDTIIKKIEPYDTEVKIENQPITVLDFLNTIKEGSENDFNDNYDVDVGYEPISDDFDDEYLIPLSIRKKQSKKKFKKKSKNTGSAIKKKYNSEKLKRIPNPIKPVYLNDIRVLPSKIIKEQVPKKPKQWQHKEEMCNHCGKMTRTLKKHLLMHTGERSFKCEKCGKGFFTELDLRHHEKRHIQSIVRTMKCEHCIATFGSKEALKSHLISHQEEKDYVCEVCNKQFKRRSALRRHKLMHNVTNKNVKCELCNMSFFSKYGLNHHMRVHTGERPYNCEICSQPYSYKHDFNRHCLKKHGVFLKRRSVNVMNEEVLKRERELMKDLLLKVHGFVDAGENINPFDGPQAAQAFEMAVKALKSKQIPIEIDFYGHSQ